MTDAASPAVPAPAAAITLRPDTLAVRAGMHRTHFEEMAEPLFLTQGYVYPNAANAEAAFAGKIDRYQYSRYGNPTVTTFEERLAAIDERAAQVIELRYFAGLTSEQAADALAISKRTADRDWTFALAFLKTDLA